MAREGDASVIVVVVVVARCTDEIELKLNVCKRWIANIGAPIWWIVRFSVLGAFYCIWWEINWK